MPQPHILTWASPADHAALADVIFDVVRNGVSRYTQSQRAACVPVCRGGEEWDARLKGQIIAIACDSNRAVGLMSPYRFHGNGFGVNKSAIKVLLSRPAKTISRHDCQIAADICLYLCADKCADTYQSVGEQYGRAAY